MKTFGTQHPANPHAIPITEEEQEYRNEQDKEAKKAMDDFKRSIRNLKYGLQQLIPNIKYYEVLLHSEERTIFCAGKETSILQTRVEEIYKNVHHLCKKRDNLFTNCACGKKLEKVVVVMEYNHNGLKFEYIIGSACIEHIRDWIYILQTGNEDECREVIEEYDDMKSEILEDEYRLFMEKYEMLYDKVTRNVNQRFNKKCKICRQKTVKIYDENKDPPYNDKRRLDICKDCIIDDKKYD